jgi:hypothetical protein
MRQPHQASDIHRRDLDPDELLKTWDSLSFTRRCETAESIQQAKKAETPHAPRQEGREQLQGA